VEKMNKIEMKKMERSKQIKMFFGLIAFLFLVASVSAIQQLVSLQGKLELNGSLVDDGNITVTIYDASTGGSLIYNSSNDFDNTIQDGYFDIMLGSSTELNLNLSRDYWFDVEVNGQDLDFSGSERKQFQSPVGTTMSGNLTVENTVTASHFVGNGSQLTETIPSGVIVMWSGSVATIPSGWALCNGSNGTPDLRERFIVGAGGDNPNVNGTGYNIADAGGEVNHTLTIAEMPSHTHSYNQPASTGYVTESGDRPRVVASSTTTGSTGGDEPHENRPPYYALAYIMKL